MPLDTRLDQLQDCTDLGALRSAIHALCSAFGSIRRLDILDASRGDQRRALCFLRMDSPENEQRLSRELGIGRFGGDLVLVVELRARHAANDLTVNSLAA